MRRGRADAEFAIPVRRGCAFWRDLFREDTRHSPPVIPYAVHRRYGIFGWVRRSLQDPGPAPHHCMLQRIRDDGEEIGEHGVANRGKTYSPFATHYSLSIHFLGYWLHTYCATHCWSV